MSKPKHTPTPWVLGTSDDAIDTVEPGQEFVVHADLKSEMGLANAEFIVKACNNHDALLAALRLALSTMEDAGGLRTSVINQLKAVIADAEREP